MNQHTRPPRVVTTEGIFILDHTGFYVPYEEPDPELPRWQYFTFWVAALGFCLGTLFLAGEGMWMAWSALL